MNIGLFNLEPKYKNLALEKIRLYHQTKGDSVEDYFALRHYDKVYCSSIFTFTKKTSVPEHAVCGGSGFDLTTTLPPEIELQQPHLDFGYTLRGCIRRCPFCIVHIKEPKLQRVGTVLDLWSGIKGTTIRLLDNNALADPEWYFHNTELAIEHDIILDPTQGYDHRLLTREIVDQMSKVRHTEYHFAYDDPSYKLSVERAIRLLQEGGINRSTWYVLVGFNTSFQDDLDRLNFLRANGQNAYVQRYVRRREYIPLAEWANQHHIFHGMTFDQFIERKYGAMMSIHGHPEYKSMLLWHD